MMHAIKCWACRDSRAFCDRLSPSCSRCTKSSRPCQYGLRLSWPKATDTKRSLTQSIQDVAGTANGFSQTAFVNATSWDIQLHNYLRMNQGLGNHKGFAFQKLDPPMALSWLPINLCHEEKGLFDHFTHTALSTLAIFEPSKNEFLSLLVRLALSDNSPSSMAVLTSALALSSFHRYGLQAHAVRFKAHALRSLIISCNQSIESPRVIQHIAASMILCHLEMLGMPNELSLWFCHLKEARKLIDNAGLDSKNHQGEFSRILDWVEYHMVMSRFSHRHWYLDAESIRGTKNLVPGEPGSCHLQKVTGVSYGSHEILRHFYIMFEMIRKPTDSLYHSDEYENSLRCLENRIGNIGPFAPGGISSTVSGLSTAWVATIELFKLAALIYLKRASRNFSGPSIQIDEMVERAFMLLVDLETFTPAFPLLIIGCEARTDVQRMRILGHIESAMKTSSLRSLYGLQNILQQIWVQDELAVDYELDYLGRLNAVISSYRIMPSFA